MPQAETKAFDRLIFNANIATMAKTSANALDGYGIIEHGCVGINNGLIAYVGDYSADFQANDKIDAQGQWLTPGLIDCHTHLVYGGNRANEFEMRLNGATYEEIARAGGGILSTVAATRLASEEELFQSAAKRLQNFIEEGVTSIEIKSGYGLDLDNELKMLRVAKRLGAEFPIRVCTTY